MLVVEKVYEIKKSADGNPYITAGEGFFTHPCGLSVVPWGTFAGQHVAIISKGFDPQRHELLVIDKNPRQIWLENDHDTFVVHTDHPVWSGQSWVSGSCQSVPEIEYDVKPKPGTVVEFVERCIWGPPAPPPPERVSCLLCGWVTLVEKTNGVIRCPVCDAAQPVPLNDAISFTLSVRMCSEENPLQPPPS